LTKRIRGVAWIAAGCIFLILAALLWSDIQSRSNLIGGLCYRFLIGGFVIYDTDMTFILASVGAICFFLGSWNLRKKTGPNSIPVHESEKSAD